jgi:hypothetical protein
MCMCFWNVATCKLTVRNGKLSERWLFVPFEQFFNYIIGRSVIVDYDVYFLVDQRNRIYTPLSYQLRDIYSMCMCFWNVATCKLTVRNGKLK